MARTAPKPLRSGRVGVGLLGTGYMAAKHSEVLAQSPRVELRRVCATRRSLNNAHEFVSRYGYAEATIDFEDLLGNDVDLVWICSPDETHAAYVLKALDARKDVFCEKPLARRSEDFRAIGDRLAAGGSVVQVGMNCRFRSQFDGLQRLASTGDMGDMRFLRGTYVQNAVETVKNADKPWILDVPAGINQFLHGGGVHVLDLMRWVGGEIVDVFARATGFELAAWWPLDTFSVSLRFQNGAIGELLVSAAAFGPNDFELEAWFERGSSRGNLVYPRDGDRVSSEPLQLAGRQEQPDLELQLENLLDAMERREQPLNSFAEGLANFRTLEAIERSIEAGTPVAPELDRARQESRLGGRA